MIPLTLGEVINPEDWGLRVEVVGLAPIELRVVKCETMDPYMKRVFAVGTTLRMKPVNGLPGRWSIDDSTMPWYVLSIRGDRKRFEHYR